MAKYKSFSDIVKHYANYKLYRSKVESFYTSQDVEAIVKGYSTYFKGVMSANHVNTVVTKADLCMPAGHQKWIDKWPAYAQRVQDTLSQSNIFQCKGNFEDLYKELFKLDITKADLYRYDLCLRIGQCINIFPKDKVYLHKGALKGALELERLKWIQLPKQWRHCVDVSIFSQVFPNSTAKDIEDMLCIYKRSFKTIKHVP